MGIEDPSSPHLKIKKFRTIIPNKPLQYAYVHNSYELFMSIPWNERKTLVASMGLLIIISVYITIKYSQGAFP